MPETIDSAKAAASTLFLGHNGEWWDFSLIIAGILVAIAATAAVVATAGSIVAHKREAAAAEEALATYKLDTEGKIKSAEAAGDAAKEGTAKANERIAELSAQAESLRKDTAEANARATEARLALEKFKAPRVLSAEQLKRVRSAIEKFAGTPFDVSVNLETEPQNLAGQIGTLLEASGWAWKDRNTTPGLAFNVGKHQTGVMGNFTGLAIEIDASKSDVWEPVVLALGNALMAEGLALFMNKANDNSASPDAIHLYFGTKK